MSERADALRIRLIEDTDSREELTELLHRAYAPLAAMGLRFLASHQDVEITRRRLAKGEGYLLFDGARLVGTILVVPPSVRAPYCGWYDRPDVAAAMQFAIEPDMQRQGLGSRLLEFAENRARALGAAELTVDTSEQAVHLLAYYLTRGYREVGREQWGHTNYRSVLLSKSLG